MQPPPPYDGFWDWLEEPGTEEECGPSRASVIRRFVRQGLVPWLKERGYELCVSDIQLGDMIANGFYDNRAVGHAESCWPAALNVDWYDEDRWHYESILSEEAWAAFWEDWTGWLDVHPDSFRGQDRRQDVEALIWNCIDIAKSEQTITVNHMCMDSEDEHPVSTERRKGTTDVYLQEAEGWGGYRR